MKLRDIMTPAPIGLAPDETVTEAARIMRDGGIGDVLVQDNGKLVGIVTDRDIVVRAVAAGLDPGATRLDEICSANLIVLSPEDDVVTAMRAVSEHAVLRLPVVDDGTPVGVVSIGDLALKLGERSALADVAAAPPNI